MFNRNQMDIGGAGQESIEAPGTIASAAPANPAFAKIISWCLAALVFLTPLLFLPFTSEVREFNKMTFVFLSVVVMLAAWVIKILTTRSVSWVKTSLDYILLAYGLVFLLSSLFSLDKVSSFLGYYGRFSGSFLSVFSLLVLYYVIVNNVRTKELTDKLINALLASGGIAIIYSLLQVLGIHILPFEFAKSTSFNPVGSLVSLGIFTALIMILVQWAWLVRENGKLRQAFYAAVTLCGLLVLFFISSFVSWLMLAIGLMAFLALSMALTGQQNSNWIWKPLLVLVVSILFVGFQFLPNSVNPRNWIGSSVRLPLELQLSNSATWEMTKNALSEKPVLGFGPGTTGIAFGQIKPESLNQSIVWNLNFDRATSEVASLAIETGLLGLLAFEAAAALFLLYALYFLMRHPEHPGRLHALGLFTVWAVLYASHFFYFYNATMHFLFWLTLAMFVAITHWKDGAAESRSMSFSDSPRSALTWMFSSLLILAVLLVGGFFQIAVYFADVAYASGLNELRKEQPDLNRSGQLFLSAIQRNQYRDVYYLAYGQNLVFLAAQEAGKQEPDIARFQAYIRDMIAAGNTATSLSPNKAANWSARSQFYSQIRALAVPGTDDVIVQSAEEAVEKDQRNPVLLLQLAQAYSNAAETIDPSIVSNTPDTDGDGLGDSHEQELGSNPRSSDSNGNGVSDGDEVKAGFNPAGTGRLNAAQLQRFTKIDQDKLRLAEEALKKSIEIKPDLPNSYVALARVYERWNKQEDARKILEQGARTLPNNADLKYELGRILFNLRDSAAEGVFNEVIKLVPNHANAHYSLGLVALQKNDQAKALEEFRKTLEIAGSNTELENLIKELEQQPAQNQAETGN